MGAVLSLCVYVGLFLLTQPSIPQPQLSVLPSTQALCDFLRGRHRFSSSRQKSRPVSWPSQHRADLATCPWVWAPVFLLLRGHSRGGQRTTSGVRLSCHLPPEPSHLPIGHARPALPSMVPSLPCPFNAFVPHLQDSVFFFFLDYFL